MAQCQRGAQRRLLLPAVSLFAKSRVYRRDVVPSVACVRGARLLLARRVRLPPLHFLSLVFPEIRASEIFVERVGDGMRRRSPSSNVAVASAKPEIVGKTARAASSRRAPVSLTDTPNRYISLP